MADRERRGTVDSFHWQLDAEGNDVLAMSHPKDEEIAEEDPRSFLSKKELKILDCINFLRANPSTFADKMMEIRQFYDGNTLRIPNLPIVRTKEGTEAFDEAINRLRNIEGSLPPLKPVRGLILGCQDHVGDQWTDEENRIGHTGTDGSNCVSRGRRYGNWGTTIGECMSYGERDPWRVLTNWLIDDGLQTRSHREHLLNEKFTVVGIACGAQRTQGIVIVVSFSDKYTDEDEKFEERDPQLAKNYKAARKRHYYAKNQTITKTKTVSTRSPDQKKKGGCYIS